MGTIPPPTLMIEMHRFTKGFLCQTEQAPRGKPPPGAAATNAVGSTILELRLSENFGFRHNLSHLKVWSIPYGEICCEVRCEKVSCQLP